ncbi:MAG: hypothetical protein ABEJ95_01630 [Candidatus Nanohalobium sp.]
MNKRRYRETPRERWLKKLNKSSESVKNQGQKLQLPVRFERKTLKLIENISSTCGVSKAEAVRRLVKLGINRSRSDQK